MDKTLKASFFALLAALLYSFSSPFSKVLLSSFPPTLLAGVLYLGAGIGTSTLFFTNKNKERERIDKSDMVYVILMVILDIAAPVFMMKGLSITRSENASLLENFEIVATAIIALLFFRERVSRKSGLAILLITLSSFILSYNRSTSFSIDKGSLLIILATCFWGLENNCTRRLRNKDPMETVAIKGIFSGSGGVILGLIVGERLDNLTLLIPALILGFFSYGMSIYFYIYAQRYLGAAKTSAYYAVNPFIGVILSFLIFKEMPAPTFYLALLFMAAGSLIITIDSLNSQENPCDSRL